MEACPAPSVKRGVGDLKGIEVDANLKRLSGEARSTPFGCTSLGGFPRGVVLLSVAPNRIANENAVVSHKYYLLDLYLYYTMA